MAQTGNWTEERSSTQGTGDIVVSGTLSNDSVLFRESLQAGEIWYAVKNNNNLEAGKGIFDGVDTIQRIDIGATYENGIYNLSNPSPINLTGASVVSCTFNTAAFKELEIGNPPVDGYVLSSTLAGVRNWIDVTTGGVTPWGGLTGDFRNQSDLINNFTVKIANVATLRATDGVTDGRTISLLGYAANGDGGGGNFYWDAASTEADNGGTIFAVGGVATGRWIRDESNILSIAWFGALEGNSNAAITTAAFNSAFAVLKLRPQGGMISVPEIKAASFYINAPVLVPEKCGITGASRTSSRVTAADGVDFGAGRYMFENETKTGVGQEYFFIEKLSVNGNRGNGALCGGILGQQIYVNSLLSDLVVQECSGNNIAFVASPDLATAGDGGPVELRNVWSFSCSGNTLRVEGNFGGVNLIGGAYENPDAGSDVIHIDGALYGGTRAKVKMFSPHLEFSNANVNGIYINKAIVDIYGLESIGNQDATQYNVFVNDDNVSSVSISGTSQSTGTRQGIHFNVSGLTNNNNYVGQMSTLSNIDVSPHLSNGTAGTDITLDMQWNDITSLSAGSATSIADFTNVQKRSFYLRFANNNYTIRHNANIVLKSGSDKVAVSGSIVEFIRIDDVFYEITGMI